MGEETNRQSLAEIRGLLEWGEDAADNILGRRARSSKKMVIRWEAEEMEMAVGSIWTRTSVHDCMQEYAGGRQHNEEEKYGKNTFKLINCINLGQVDTNCQKPISNHQLSPVRGIGAKKPKFFYSGALSFSSLSSSCKGLPGLQLMTEDVSSVLMFLWSAAIDAHFMLL